MATGYVSPFHSLLAAYAWCVLRRHFKPFLKRDLGFAACLALADDRLAGSFESAAHRLFENKAPSGVRILDDDGVTFHVRKDDRRASPMIMDLENRRCLIMFSPGSEIPALVRATAHVFIEVGTPDAASLRAAVYKHRGVRISDEDAAFLATLPLGDVAIALRSGIDVGQGIRVLRKVAKTATSVDLTEQPASPVTANLVPNIDLLQNLRGYGESVLWGLQLARDLHDYRQGRIGWDAVDRGLLLFGPPGTGKTRFAKVLAEACGVTLHVGSYARWQEKGHQGDMLRAMRKTFKDAVDDAPSIVAIDEIDTFLVRGTAAEHDSYMTAVTNALLEHLDGLSDRTGVVVVATTNNKESIDPAILRAGRIDTHIEVPLPDAFARLDIMESYLNAGIPAELREGVAKRTVGLSGADLEFQVRKAHRLARTLQQQTTVEHLLEVLPALNKLPEEVLWPTAVHESGHAVVGLALGFEVVSASIDDSMSTATATHRAGSVEFASAGPRRLTRAVIEANVKMLLGGMAAEREVFGEHDIGSSISEMSDLSQATSLVTRLELAHGMGETFISEDSTNDVLLNRLRQSNPMVWQRIDAALKDFVAAVQGLIAYNRDALLSLAGELLRVRTMTGREIDDFLKKNALKITIPSSGDDIAPEPVA